MIDALSNIGAYALQLAALVLVALAGTAALRIRIPTHLLRFWQCVLAMALLLPFAQPWHTVTSGTPMLFAAGSDTVSETQAQATASWLPSNWPQLAIAVIAIGIAMRLLWLAVGMLRVRSLVANARRDAAFASLMTELQDALGVRAAVMVSDSIEGPATVGMKHPVVLIPASVLAMNPGVQRAILAHELIHVQRRDWLNTIGEEIWCAILWFHPLARVVASRLSLAREMVVDEQTILLTRDRRAYAEALLAFSNPQPHLVGVTPFIGRRTLSQRISSIAQEVPMSHRRAVVSIAIAMIASISVSAAAVNRFPMSTTVQKPTVYRPGNGVTLPSVVRDVKPAYTAAAMQAKIQGSVWLECVITAEGDVDDVTVSRSLDTEHGLDAEAVKAAKMWKFRPGQKDGKPVAVMVTLELTFRLKK